MQVTAKRTAATFLFAAGIAVGGAGAASAETEWVGGGTWSHGIEDDTVYSYYAHSDVCHGSTAVGTTTVRDEAPAGYTSQAEAPEAWYNNQTYWHKGC